MDDYERGFLEAFLSNFSTRLARDMRSALAEETLLDEDDRLTPVARAYTEGYVASQLSAVRGSATGNSSLGDDDFDAIENMIARNEGEIASELYS